MATSSSGLNRRDFLKTAACSAGALAAAGGAEAAADRDQADRPQAPAPAPAQPAPLQAPRLGDRPRIGCVSWCFHSFAGGTSPEEAIEIMGRIGFEGTDLILLSREDIEGFWTQAMIDNIRRRLERNRLAVAQFVVFQPVVEGLPSADPAERERDLDFFEAGCRIGAKLGAPIIDIVAPWPRELSGPRDYLPRYFDIEAPKAGEKFHIEIAEGFDWERTFETFTATVKACLERAKHHGLKLTIEHHTHTIVPEASSFLRLFDAIGDPDLGYNLDTGWTLLQREYPPLAIHKTKRCLMNLHVRDIDNLMRRFVHVGEGVMDFQAIAAALKAVGFTGFLSIEQDKHPGDMEATCRRYLAMMKEYLA